MIRYSTLLLFVVGLIGCSGDSPDAVQRHVPSGSQTQSVAAAEAYNRGVALRNDEKLKAIEEFTAAIELDPNFESAIYNRALTHAELGGDAEALADLARLKELKSAQAETLEGLLQALPALHIDLGQQDLENKDFKAAANRFTAALLHHPNDPILLELRAASYDGMEMDDEAKADRTAAETARKNGIESVLVEAE